MARYINEDEFVAWVKEHWCADCQNDNGLRCRACWIDDAIDIVEEAPEADVVPKSEVESIITLNSQLEAQVFEQRKEIERLKKYNTDVAFKHYNDGKTEVAGEIFAEIEKMLDGIMIVANPNDGFITTFRKTMDKVTAGVAELEKKYTEGE